MKARIRAITALARVRSATISSRLRRTTSGLRLPLASSLKHALLLLVTAARWLVDFMRDGRGQLAHGCQPGNARKFHLRHLQCLLRLLSLEDSPGAGIEVSEP